jgi:hypothetical protein
MAPVACVLFKALLVALKGLKTAGEGRCNEPSRALALGGPAGQRKKPETGGTPPAPIKIDAGFELPVADHP